MTSRMSTNVDSRSVPRGWCTACACPEYNGGEKGLKCINLNCAHPPGKHQNLAHLSTSSHSRPHDFQMPAATPTASSGARHLTTQYGDTGGYATHNYQYQPPVTKSCSAPGCSRPSYYDPKVGEFDYCSPECRNQDLLHRERQRLRDDLKSFEDKLHLPAAGKKQKTVSQGGKANSGYGASDSGVKSPTASSTGNVQLMIAYGLPCSGTGPQSSYSESPGKQKTIPFHLQKGASKDPGLILSGEIYRTDSTSGLLVLGFKYGTKAEHLLVREEVCLLDVIVSVNGKDVGLSTHADIVRSQACSLVLDRSIALPYFKPLMDKATLLHPTHVLAILHPQDIPFCSVKKGFGFEIIGTAVRSVKERTPARFSKLAFDDEIIAFGFVKDKKLELGRGLLTDEKLKAADSAGKTVVLAIKRKQ